MLRRVGTMDTNLPLNDQKERHNFLVEVVDSEKQLWALIHSKGIVNAEVQELYRKIRSTYETIILDNHELVEIEDFEFSLWKLHYKHIDEFRKTARQSPNNSESTKLEMPRNNQIEGFKVFLSEAAEFYKNLISKVRKAYGILEEPLAHKSGGVSTFDEPKRMCKVQFLCHRLFVCIGDLVRYKELYERSNIKTSRNWSVAAKYYFKATMFWPDGGNPHNQLALLATYLGDELLALYHCIRSLAVKDPFPDAWDNLILLFEKNRSSNLNLLITVTHFDFSRPFESICIDAKLQTSDVMETGLWSLIVRTTSFFFIKDGLEDLPCSFGSTIRELEKMIGQDDSKLKHSLESYQCMDSSRRGPFRAIQIVAILVFIIDNLTKKQEQKESKDKTDLQDPALMQLALSSVFIFMGRLVERCSKGNTVISCPLLPALLVFLEWLVKKQEELESFGADEKIKCAISYFFGALTDLLNLFGYSKREINSRDSTALWEDFELLGFAPIAHAHISLDFSNHLDNINGYENRNDCRVHRIVHAAMTIASMSPRLIFYDKLEGKFCNKETEECEGKILEQNQSKHSANGKSVSMEEEEVILFKPITRYNSAPVDCFISTLNDIYSEGQGDQTEPSDECLRRASSLLTAQKEVSLFSAGPPSLSAWVLNRESLGHESDKRPSDIKKYGLKPIVEMASESFTGLSLSENGEDSEATHYSSPPYSAPVPSAPLLPEDADWFHSDSSEDFASSGPSCGPQHCNWANNGPLGYISGNPPSTGIWNPSQLFSNHNPDRVSSPVWPINTYGPNYSGNLNDQALSRFDLFDQRGIPVASSPRMYVEGPPLPSGFLLGYGVNQQWREKPYNGYQRQDLREEQLPLLQYLKEREWQLQREQQVKGPTYMGN